MTLCPMCDGTTTVTALGTDRKCPTCRGLGTVTHRACPWTTCGATVRGTRPAADRWLADHTQQHVRRTT